MKKKYKIAILILLLLVAIRIYLPFGITRYVNDILDDIPGYTGSIHDVDLFLLTGSYSIDSLQIFKEEGTIPVPLFLSKRVDLSIEWSALMSGAIVGQVEMINPQINFVTAKDTTQAQYGEDVDWTKPLKKLLPLRINRLVIEDGEMFFKNFQSRPQVDLYLREVDLSITNLTNAESTDKSLPSKLKASAISIGDGKLSVGGQLNVLKEIPDVDIDFEFEQVALPSLNDFLRVYAGIDAEEGEFNLYSEILIDDGKLTGYAKPLIQDLNLVKWDADKDKPLQMIWEVVAGSIFEVFENQKKSQFATKAPFSGDLSDPETRLLPTIWNIFSNAFIDAFDKTTDNTLEYGAKENDK
ncbi:MAG: DUF748 domain-containing protein [Cyclobacteriaceae bacterium]